MNKQSMSMVNTALWVVVAYYFAIPVGLAIATVVILMTKGFDILSPYTVFFLVANVVLIILWTLNNVKRSKPLKPILKSIVMTGIGFLIAVLGVGAVDEFKSDIPQKQYTGIFGVIDNNLAEIIPYLGIASLIVSILLIIIAIAEDYESEVKRITPKR